MQVWFVMLFGPTCVFYLVPNLPAVNQWLKGVPDEENVQHIAHSKPTALRLPFPLSLPLLTSHLLSPSPYLYCGYSPAFFPITSDE